MGAAPSNELETRIFQHNPDDVDEFQKILDEFPFDQSEMFKVWKISCLYHILISSNINHDIGYTQQDIITSYLTTKAQIQSSLATNPDNQYFQKLSNLINIDDTVSV